MSVCRRPDYEQSDELGVKISGLGSMPMWLSVHPSGAWAYTVDMSGDGSVHAHAVSPLSGALTPINSQPSRGSGPCHLTATQNFVLCANYSGGTISVLPIEANGGLGPAVEYKDHGTTQGSGAGVHVRQDMAHPHQILLDPSGKRCYVPDLGTNKVHAYLWNADTGALTEPSELLLHDGAGPRHMCFSPVTSPHFPVFKGRPEAPRHPHPPFPVCLPVFTRWFCPSLFTVYCVAGRCTCIYSRRAGQLGQRVHPRRWQV